MSKSNDDLIIGTNRKEKLNGGGGDDTIYGAGKDDKLIGGGDNDHLYGEAGDDWLLGGDGDDLLDGGTGDDTLDGNGGFDTAFYLGNSDDYVISLLNGGRSEITDLNAADGDDGTDILHNIESLEFAGDVVIHVGPDGEAIFDPTGTDRITWTMTPTDYPDGDGVNDHIRVETDPGDMVAVFADASDFIFNATPAGATLIVDGDFSLTTLAPTTIHFNGNSGVDIVDASGLVSDHSVAAFGAGGDDTLTGGAGGDDIGGGLGNDRLEGGAGVDTAVFSGAPGGYALTFSGDTVTAVDTDPADGDEGTDILTGFEFARFDNNGGTPTTLDLTAAAQGAFDASVNPETDWLVSAQAGAPAGRDFIKVDILPDGLVSLLDGPTDLSFTGGAGANSLTVTGSLDNTTLLGGALVFNGLGGADAVDGDSLTSTQALIADGGTGEDVFLGGAGDDSLTGGADLDTAHYGGAFSAYSLAFGPGEVIVADTDAGDGHVDGTDRLSAIERLVFGDGTVVGLGTDPTLGTFTAIDPETDWIVDPVAGGPEGRDFIRVVTQPGSTTALLDGPTALSFTGGSGANSLTMTGDLANTSLVPGTLSFAGLGGADTVDADGSGSLQSIIADGGAGDDVFFGGAGDDSLDGGADHDTAHYGGVFTAYAIAVDGDALIVSDVDGADGQADGVDRLTNMEEVVFGDGTVLHLGVPVGGLATYAGDASGFNEWYVTNAPTTTPSVDFIRVESVSALGSFVEYLLGPTDLQFDGGTSDDYLNVAGDFTNTTLAPSTIYFNGAAGNDEIDGSAVTSAHNLVFDGGADGDTFNGGAGDDTFQGGTGFDVAQYDGAFSAYAVSVSGNEITVQDTDASDGIADGTDLLVDVERVDFADGYTLHLGEPPFFYADDADGDWVVTAVDGLTPDGLNDFAEILSQPSNETDLAGHIISLRFYGGTGSNTLTLQGSFDPSAFSNTLAFGFFGGDGDDILDGSGLLSTDGISGSGQNGDDTLIGGAGNDLLNGGNDNDLMIGGGGNDQMNGGAGFDTVHYAGAFADYTINLVHLPTGTFSVTDLNAADGDDGADSLSNVERITFGDGSLIDLTTTGTATFGAGNWRVTTSSGLNGHFLVQVTNLDTGVIQEYGAITGLTFTGDGSNDKLEVIGDFSATSLWPGGIEFFGDAGDDSIIADTGNVAIIGTGGDDDDTLIGGAGDDHLGAGGVSLPGTLNLLVGNGGADTLVGGSAEDVILGGTGNDLLYDHAATDLTDGDDTLVGGAGDDTLLGSEGFNTLSGDGGNDLIILEDALGGNNVDGGTGDDTILVSKATATFAGVGASIDGGSGNDTLLLPDAMGSYTMTQPNYHTDPLVVSSNPAAPTPLIFDIESNAGASLFSVTNVETIAFDSGESLSATVYGGDFGGSVIPALFVDVAFVGSTVGTTVWSLFDPSTSPAGNIVTSVNGVQRSPFDLNALEDIAINSGKLAIDLDLTFTANGGPTELVIGDYWHPGLPNFDLHIEFFGGAMADSVILDGSVPAGLDPVDLEAHGGAGNDWLEGLWNDDRLYGDDGADTLFGGRGDDTLTGGDGADLFTMSAGSDVVTDFSAIEGDLVDASGSWSVGDDGFGNALITDATGSLVLLGVAPGAVDASWFV
ncbi:MAG: hypothetical protein ACPGO3_01110 [Magnetospiraceae bacterium]